MLQNRTNLQGILRKHADVFKGDLGSMKDITVKLTVKPDSKLNASKLDLSHRA